VASDPAWTRQAIKAMCQAVEHEHDFAGWLAAVLAQVAAAKGSSDALTAGASWELGGRACGPAGEGDGGLPRRVSGRAGSRGEHPALTGGKGRVCPGQEEYRVTTERYYCSSRALRTAPERNRHDRP